MADMTRHEAITALRKYIEANVSQFDGRTDGDPTHVHDGAVPIGGMPESRMPFMMVVEGSDEIDDRITFGRDIILRLGLTWVYKDGLDGKTAMETGRNIEDALIKKLHQANTEQLPVAGTPTILMLEILPSNEPFIWPDIHNTLSSRGRVITIKYRQES